MTPYPDTFSDKGNENSQAAQTRTGRANTDRVHTYVIASVGVGAALEKHASHRDIPKVGRNVQRCEPALWKQSQSQKRAR